MDCVGGRISFISKCYLDKKSLYHCFSLQQRTGPKEQEQKPLNPNQQVNTAPLSQAGKPLFLLTTHLEIQSALALVDVANQMRPTVCERLDFHLR